MTRDEWISWKNSESTKKVFEYLEQEKTYIEKQWSAGAFKHSEIENAKQIGVIEGIDKVIYMEVEDEE